MNTSLIFWITNFLYFEPGGTMAYTLDTQLGTLLDNPQAKAVLEQYFPGISTNPMVGMVRGVSLNSILSMPQAAQMGITKDKVEAALVEVNKVVK
jgi:hypothetical protein